MENDTPKSGIGEKYFTLERALSRRKLVQHIEESDDAWSIINTNIIPVAASSENTQQISPMMMYKKGKIYIKNEKTNK